MGVLELDSVSILPILALPANSVASSSIVGPRALHGPHHSAQKSTSTGSLAFKTSISKFASVNSLVLAPAMWSLPWLLTIKMPAQAASRTNGAILVSLNGRVKTAAIPIRCRGGEVGFRG